MEEDAANQRKSDSQRVSRCSPSPRLMEPETDGNPRKDEQMAQIQFREDEEKLMQEILEGYLRELSSEISSTDTFSFRQDLKRKKELVRDMLGRLEGRAA